MPQIITLIFFIVSLIFFTGLIVLSIMSAISSAKKTRELERHMKH